MEKGFYQTFNDLLQKEKDEEKSHSVEGSILAIHDLESEKSNNIKTFKSTIEEIIPSLIGAVVKPQRLIQDDKDWYIAQDLKTNTFYICYRTLLMVDIDFYKENDIKISDLDWKIKTIEQQKRLIDKIEDYALLNDLTFRIYRTRNGLHAFLVSKLSNYKNYADLKIMSDLGCDYFYIAYSRIRGWSVRLNRKTTENEMSYKFICDVGDMTPDPHLLAQVDLHIELLDVFKDAGPSDIYGN